MHTSNAIYGSALSALATPNPGAGSVLPGILPHYRQTTYPLQPRHKTQTFTVAAGPAGEHMALEKFRTGGGASTEQPHEPEGQVESFGSTGNLRKGAWLTETSSAHIAPAVAKQRAATRRDVRASAPAGTKDVPEPLVGDPVLRFLAYSQETVPDSPLESGRVRRYSVLFYTADGTVEINEPKTDNSGLVQGCTVMRQRLTRHVEEGADSAEEAAEATAARPLTWRDLVVGSNVWVHGRVFRTYDADGFTRAWCASQGVPQGAAEAVPFDVMTAKAAQAALSGAKTGVGNNRTMFPAKQFIEARLGKFIRDPEARRRFQDHDGQALRFECAWQNPWLNVGPDDDGAAATGGSKPRCAGTSTAASWADSAPPAAGGGGGGPVTRLVLSYSLADGEAEVRLADGSGEGMPGGSVLVKRMPLPKDWAAARGLKPSDSPHLFVRPADIVVGRTLDVFGRAVHVRACDAATRAWYASDEAASAEYGAAPQPPDIVEPAATAPTLVHAVPPHIGIGDEDDSLRSCFSIDVKAPLPDLTRFLTFDGTVYRLAARRAGAAGLEAQRRFTVAIYPADDTMCIFEQAIPNTGIKGGVFLKRFRYRNAATGKPYTPADFAIGRIADIFANKLLVMDADATTRDRFPVVFGDVAALKLDPTDPAYNPLLDAPTRSAACGASLRRLP